MNYDIEFLKQLDTLKIRVQYAKIILLSFDEQPIQEIQGTITNGTLSVNGSAAVRRTINLSMLTGEEDLENINNLISLNKKIKVEIGYQNPFKNNNYGDIIWFPCGLFIINSASSSRSTNGISISISGKDKMAMLDGTAGGAFPASVVFHEKYITDNEDNITVLYPTIYQIIQEAVVHYGDEHINNVIINDVPDTAKLLLKWIGDTPLYIDSNNAFTIIKPVEDDFQTFYTGSDVCYETTDFTYPGELIMSAGETVVALLDKVVKTLGNFEFFYNIDGKFVFQQKKNYLDITSPLLEITAKDYFKNYSNELSLWAFDDLETVTSINKSPKYENIKNDFIVWGTRTSSSGAEIGIRYHLAIDKKPMLDKSLQYMYELRQDDKIIGYEFRYNSNEATDSKILKAGPAPEWREELYRNALAAQYTTGYYSDYDAELLAEWRKLYDPTNPEWNNTQYWNPAAIKDPRQLDYWLDFIDTEALESYSVKNIGKRSKIINDNKVKSIQNQTPVDIIVIRNTDANYSEAELTELINYYKSYGQKYVVLSNSAIADNLIASSTGASAFDRIRDLLYQHLNYNTTLTLTCLPKFFLEPNNLVYIYDEKSHINGNYAITQFSLPLGYSGTMSITATEALRRV